MFKHRAEIMLEIKPARRLREPIRTVCARHDIRAEAKRYVVDRIDERLDIAGRRVEAEQPAAGVADQYPSVIEHFQAQRATACVVDDVLGSVLRLHAHDATITQAADEPSLGVGDDVLRTRTGQPDQPRRRKRRGGRDMSRPGRERRKRAPGGLDRRCRLQRDLRQRAPAVLDVDVRRLDRISM